MTTPSRAARDAVLAALADYGRAPQTTASVAARVFYVPGYIRQILHALAAAGEIVQDGGVGQLVLWSLPPLPPTLVHCGRCGRDKPESEFYVYRKTGRRHPGCKACRRRQSREQWLANPRPSRRAA